MMKYIKSTFILLTILFGFSTNTLWAENIQSNSFEKSQQSAKRVYYLLDDFDGIDSEMHWYKNYKTSAQCKLDKKFMSLFETRKQVFLFHHFLIYKNEKKTNWNENESHLELLFNRETSFIGNIFYTSRTALKQMGVLKTSKIEDWKLFLKELLLYYNKIIQVKGWEDKFKSLLKDNIYGLAHAAKYHAKGFEKNQNPCYLKSNLYDYSFAGGTEGWFYSFWLRRYKEGNFQLVKVMIDWGLAYLSNQEFIENSESLKFKKDFYKKQQQKKSKQKAKPLKSPMNCDNISMPASPSFKSAYHKSETIYSFPSFIPVDWKSKTPEKYSSISMRNTAYEDFLMLREKYSNYFWAEFNYETPLDCSINQGHYYIISDEGISKVKPIKFEGRVGFSMGVYGVDVNKVDYHGLIIAEDKNSKNSGGGFALFLDKEIKDFHLNRDVDFKIVPNGKGSIYEYTKNKTYQYKIERGGFSEIVKKYSFSIEGKYYIFVRWGGYHACESSYSLFEVDKDLKQLIWNAYQCDV